MIASWRSAPWAAGHLVICFAALAIERAGMAIGDEAELAEHLPYAASLSAFFVRSFVTQASHFFMPARFSGM